jgi:hypothetical protein
MQLKMFLLLLPLTILFVTPRNAGAQGLGPRVDALEAAVAALEGQVDDQRGTIRILRRRLQALSSNPVLALGPHVMVMSGDLLGVAGPHIIFKQANIHIQSGTGTTHLGALPVNGLGNLFLGYNEIVPGEESSLDNRFGSHNLVVGIGHQFPSTGGFVAGERNTIGGVASTVSGGALNVASAFTASVSGGGVNTASEAGASVSGGLDNTASGLTSNVSGGAHNVASGENAVVSGGNTEVAASDFDHVP